MIKVSEATTNSMPYKPPHHCSKHHHQRTTSPLSLYSPKLSIYLLAACVTLFILFQIQSLDTPPPPPWTTFIPNWHKAIAITNASTLSFNTHYCTQELKSMAAKLRRSVTFLPLKDLRYAATAQQGHTWFMSSMYDTHQEGEVQFQHFPSEASQGRLLCMKGRDTHNGAWNLYALAWPETLPPNATLMKGLTFVSYNHYNYDNIWHGLSAMVPFVAWHIKNGCAVPTRWTLYHWGELRTRMGPWLRSLMEATYGGPLSIEGFDGAACFEEAVVMRHNEGGMSRERRMEAYDLMRCKARLSCNVSLEGRGAQVNDPVIGLTLFMRTGARSFRNESAVVGIFDRECQRVNGCRLMVAHSNNLTFCEQVGISNPVVFLIINSCVHIYTYLHTHMYTTIGV